MFKNTSSSNIIDQNHLSYNIRSRRNQYLFATNKIPSSVDVSSRSSNYKDSSFISSNIIHRYRIPILTKRRHNNLNSLLSIRSIGLTTSIKIPPHTITFPTITLILILLQIDILHHYIS